MLEDQRDHQQRGMEKDGRKQWLGIVYASGDTGKSFICEYARKKICLIPS